MTNLTISATAGKQEPRHVTQARTSLAFRVGLSVIFLICSLAIFLLGSNYYQLFPTNSSRVYALSLSSIFLIAALVFKRSKKLAGYWQIIYAFFIASVVNLVSALFSGYNTDFVNYFGLMSPNKTLGLAKLYDALLVIIPILVLTRLSGANLGTLFLKKGNLNTKWGLGVGSLVLVNFFTSVLIFFGTEYEMSGLGSAILWGAVFSFSNGMLEELWIRGLFLKKLVPLVGATGAILLTSILFGSLHFLSVAFFPAIVVPVFVINAFTLGLACGILMLKTDSIWGAFLIHSAADLFLFIATLAAR